MEMRLGLFDRYGEGVVVSFAADGELDLISALPRVSQNSPEDVSGGAKHVGIYSRREWLKPRLVTVAAFVAAEAELKPSIGRKVIEIGCKLDERHVKSSFGKITEQMKFTICHRKDWLRQ